jgi:hypothetical protein
MKTDMPKKRFRIVVKRVNQLPVIEEVEDDFEAIQQIVGGHFECLKWDDRSYIFLNDEGFIKNLPRNIVAPEKFVPMTTDATLRGDIFAIGYSDQTGESRSLNIPQIAFFMKLFREHHLRQT